MDRYQIILKIAEMRSYIASDWPSVEQRKSLYEAIRRLEESLGEKKEDPEDKPEEA